MVIASKGCRLRANRRLKVEAVRVSGSITGHHACSGAAQSNAPILQLFAPLVLLVLLVLPHKNNLGKISKVFVGCLHAGSPVCLCRFRLFPRADRSDVYSMNVQQHA